MSSQKIKFGDKEVDKKEFYSSKQAILLDSVDLNEIVVSSKWKFNDKHINIYVGILIMMLFSHYVLFDLK